MMAGFGNLIGLAIVQQMRLLTFCRRRVDHAAIDARRNLAGVCGRWYPVILELHRFFIAISRAAVDLDDGAGNARDPLFGLLVDSPRGVG